MGEWRMLSREIGTLKARAWPVIQEKCYGNAYKQRPIGHNYYHGLPIKYCNCMMQRPLHSELPDTDGGYLGTLLKLAFFYGALGGPNVGGENHRC